MTEIKGENTYRAFSIEPGRWRDKRKLKWERARAGLRDWFQLESVWRNSQGCHTWWHEREVHVGSWATSWRCYWESHGHVWWPGLHRGAWSRRAWETPWLNSAHFGSWITFWMLADSPCKTLVAAGDSFFRDHKYHNLKPAAGTAHWAVVGTWHLPCQLLLPTHLCLASMPVWSENSLLHSAKLIHREHKEDSGLLCTEASLLGRLSGS